MASGVPWRDDVEMPVTIDVAHTHAGRRLALVLKQEHAVESARFSRWGGRASAQASARCRQRRIRPRGVWSWGVEGHFSCGFDRLSLNRGHSGSRCSLPLTFVVIGEFRFPSLASAPGEVAAAAEGEGEASAAVARALAVVVLGVGYARSSAFVPCDQHFNGMIEPALKTLSALRKLCSRL